MLKEYLSEAVSLLAEAVLGKPISASAACADNPACHYLYTFHGLCGSCGVEKWTKTRVYNCWGWPVHCSAGCTYCGF